MRRCHTDRSGRHHGAYGRYHAFPVADVDGQRGIVDGSGGWTVQHLAEMPAFLDSFAEPTELRGGDPVAVVQQYRFHDRRVIEDGVVRTIRGPFRQHQARYPNTQGGWRDARVLRIE